MKKPLPPLERWLLAFAICCTFAVLFAVGMAEGHPPSANQNNCAGPGRSCAASRFIGSGGSSIAVDGGTFVNASVTNKLDVGAGGITLDGGFIMTGAGAVMAEFAGNAAGGYVNKYAGVQIGVNTFGGIWFMGGGTTPNATNYALMNAGPLLLNGAGSGIIFRDSNANRAGVDTTYGLYNIQGVGTAGSGTGIATVLSAGERHYTHVITVARTNLTAAATTQDVTLWTVPARSRVRALIADATAAFDDAAGPISAVTITCGKTAGGAEYLASGSVFTVNTLGDATAEVGASLNTYFGDVPSWSATTAVQCRFTSTGGNLSTLTTGSATFYLDTISYP